jgi:DNA-binding transcriptional regulator YhcF (GntR family)
VNFSLLKNNVYLTLLAFYNGQKMPSYTQLGVKTGLTRQTVSKKVQELIGQQLIQIDDNILNVSNTMDIDVDLLRDILTQQPGINAVELKKQLIKQEAVESNVIDLAKELHMSRSAIYNYQHAKMVVYGIISEGIIKYIGSTKNYEERMKQHMLNRPFLSRSNFIILKEITDNDRFLYERVLIQTLQPEWNIMNKEF